MMAMIVSFVSGTLGKVLVGGVLFMGAWLWVKTTYESKGAAKERAKIEHARGINAGKAANIRAKVDSLPADKLVDHYFRSD